MREIARMIGIYTLGFIIASAYNMYNIIVNKDNIGAVIFIVTIVIWVLSIINMQKTNKVTRAIQSWDIEHSKALETKRLNITNYLDIIRQNGYLASEVDNVITDEVIDGLTWRGKQSVLSATFTALGVLGTFLGLATGLGSLGRTTSDILANIDKLIPAITLAFSTSIVGLALSTLYNLTYIVLENRLFKSIDDLKKRCSIHGVDAPETLQCLNDTLNKFCNNAMIVVQKMNDMSKESEERMIKALEVFKTDVDAKLEAYRKMLDEQNTKSLTENKQIIELYRDETLDSMKEQLDKYRKDLSDWSDKLREQQDSTDQSITMLVGYGENTLKNIEEVSKRIDTIYDKLSIVNFEITDAVDKLSDNTTDLKAAIEKSDETIKEHLTGIVDSVNKSTQAVEAASEIINQQVSTAGVITDKLDTANRLLGDYTERISDMTVEMDRVLTESAKSFTNEATRTINQARDIVSDFDTSFRDNVKATGDTLKSNVDDVIRTTGNRLKEMGDRKFESVSADLEKIVEQEFKSVEAIQKLAKSIGETMIEHKQFTQDLSRESRNSRDNIETSKAISEIMSKDLDIIVRKLNAISELAEGMIKHEEE